MKAKGVSAGELLLNDARHSTDGAFASTIKYVIKRQRRKTIALHVLADASIEVRAPEWVPKSELINFVEKRTAWIVEQRAKVQKKLALVPGFYHGQQHSFLGQRYPLCVVKAARAGGALVDGSLVLKVRDPNDTQQVQKALEQWYRQQAGPCFEERMFACFEAFPDWFQDQYRIPEITIRKMRRRWGSCSSKGDVTLNLMLMKMPLACIDYVVTHELCHLEAFHHGRAFYDLLAAVMPQWRERELLIERLA
ncbi:MAG: SprT family zinc-dependent metalloprotease [Spongiibacteraceae bacterium]